MDTSSLDLQYKKYRYPTCFHSFLSMTEISSVLFIMASDPERSSVWWVYMNQSQCQQRSSICLPHLSDPLWNAVVYFHRSCIFHGSPLGEKPGIGQSLGIPIRWCGGRESRGLYENWHPITVWPAFVHPHGLLGHAKMGICVNAFLGRFSLICKMERA